MTAGDGLDRVRASLRAIDGASERAAETRRRILLGATAPPRRSLVRTFFVVAPLAAALLVSTAWAASTGRLAHVWSVARSPLFASSRAPEPSASDPPVAAPAKAQTGSPRATAPAPPPEPRRREAPPDEVRVAVVQPRAVAPVAVAPVNPAAEELRLYERAHRAHFAAHDDKRALEGWSAYLDAFPRGRFVPEARYNRAIALWRLGRADEARAALRPFADGVYGAYRRREAIELLARLDED